MAGGPGGVRMGQVSLQENVRTGEDMRLSAGECRSRFAAARHAVLASTRPDGSPHLVPIVFAPDRSDLDQIFSAVDRKPKSSTDLRRLDNIRNEPRVALLVEHYQEDWAALWWVRVDGQARVLGAGAEHHRVIELLAERYPQYRAEPPGGPVIAVTAYRWTGWAAAPAD